MKISAKQRAELYRAIYDGIIDTRIALDLPPNQDFLLAQCESAIWRRVCAALNLKESA